MLSPSVKSEGVSCDFTTANSWFNGMRDLSMARQQLSEVTPKEDWACGLFMETDPGLESRSGDYTELPLRPRANNNSARLRVKPAHGATAEQRQQSMDGTPASSQPARGVLFLFHSLVSRLSPMLGEIWRCRRNPPGVFLRALAPTTRCYLLPLSIPGHFPAPLSF